MRLRAAACACLIGTLGLSAPARVAVTEAASVPEMPLPEQAPAIAREGPAPPPAESAPATRYGALSGKACRAMLDERAVPHEVLDRVRGVASPVRATGPLSGVTFRTLLPYRATRSGIDDLSFKNVTLVYDGDAGGITDATPSLRGDTLWFARTVGNAYDIFRAPVVDGHPGAPAPVESLNTAFNDTNAHVTDDGLDVYFGTDRPGTSGSPGYDVWTAAWSAPNAAFTNTRPVPELNSSAVDMPTWVSPDGCRILIHSNRRAFNGGQNSDIYMAER